MSESEHKSVTCPGVRAMLPGQHPEYLRVVFSVRWLDGAEHPEVLYITNVPMQFDYAGIKALEARALGVLQKLDNPPRAVSATFITYATIEMSLNDMMDAGWRVLDGKPA